ncbi:MAG: DsrE/DsrF/DrsH-like family protein [Candidatus Krumholzibacteria bacterium]|nr:DsrE/DsrF/DrsH-like family protein [Candidatus Krumholzibacteria bacterium]
MGKILGVMNLGGLEAIGPTRLNMGGMRRWMFNKMMNKNNVTPLATLVKQAQEQGVRLVACEMSCNVMEIGKSDFIDGVEMGGVATFIAEAMESKFSLFI